MPIQKLMRSLLLYSFSFLTLNAAAQKPKAPPVVKIEERAYKLIEMDNGDLVPFVKTGSDSRDIYFENGKMIKKIHLGIAEDDTTGHTDYFYYGDSIVVSKEYDNKGWYKELDSTIYSNGYIRRHFNYFFRKYETEVLDEEYFIIDSLNSRLVVKQTGAPDRNVLITILSQEPYKYVSISYKDGIETGRDTIAFYNKGDSIRTVHFNREGKFNYTRREYSFDEYGNWNSMMIFYNKDTIGDHIECIIRKTYYEGKANAEPEGKEAYYGYWVSLYGNRHYIFKKNGEAEARRNPSSDIHKLKWEFDESRKMPYIIISPEELKKDPPENLEQGNRLYLYFDKKRKELTIGDFNCTQRPVLKRRPG